MRLWFLTYLLITVLSTWGQNLVPNGSFEDTVTNCYYQRWVDPGTPHIQMANNWFSPNSATPDLIAPSNICPYTGNNYGGLGEYIYANEGDRCAGIITYNGNNGTENYREYIAIKLKSLPFPQKKYCLSIDIKAYGLGRYFSNNIGVYIGPDSILQSGVNVINLTPQILISDIVSNSEWFTWNDTILTNGNEQYLFIGNFLSDSLTTLDSNTNNSLKTATYFLDNIELKLCPNQFNNHLTVYPNPSNGNLLYVDQFADTTYSVTLYNSTGQAIRYKEFPSGYYQGELFRDLSAGMYILRMQTATGYREEEKVIVVK